MTQIASSPAAPPPGLTAGPPAAAPAVPTATAPVAGAPSSAAEASTQQPPQTDPRAGIDELARANGYDPSQLASFPDLASATAAIRMATENAIRTHYAGPSTHIAPAYPQQPQWSPAPQPQYQPPQQQAQPAPTVVDLKALGLEDDEPAAKAIRVLESRLVDQSQQIAQVVASQQQQQQAVREQTRSALRAQAAQVVDSFADPTYGTSKARTAAQQINLSRLYDLADMVAQAEFNAGNPIPPLDVRLSRARLLDSSTGVGLPASPAPAPATLGALPQSAPPPVDALPQMKITDKWSQNPQLVAMMR